MNKKKPMKYNPAFLTEDELVRSFVVRQTDLEMITEVVGENTGRQSNQHVLVVGPRGIGKTTLVLRAAAEIRRTEKLCENWYPLVFAEESYQICSPGEFWLEALFHLGRQTGDAKWKDAHRELHREPDESRLRERALAQLLDFSDSINKRILLIVENFNMLLGDQLADDDAWVLRHTLQNESRIMLLASATSRFDEIENSGKAMFELFKIHELRPLNQAECEVVWKHMSGQELKGMRIRPIQILTGGSPRLLMIVSLFGARLSFKKLMADLMQLVDEHTEYFKSHLDGLPPIERKVYLALAEIWDPATARQVADAARINVNKTSSLLKRLIQRGAVVEAGKDRRKKIYQVAERMYNIYYLMRRRGMPSSRVRAVVNFMTSFYEPEELLRTTRMFAEEACRLAPEDRRDHYLFYEAILEKEDVKPFRHDMISNMPSDFFNTPDFPKSIDKIINEELDAIYEQADNLLKKSEGFEEAEAKYRKAIQIAPAKPYPWTKFGVFLYLNSNRFEESEKVFHKAIELKTDYKYAWAGLGYLCHEYFERYDEAEKAYLKAVEIDSKYDWAWAVLGNLYHERLERYGEAEKAYLKAVELDSKFDWAWAKLGQLYHERLERYEDAEKAYSKAVEIDSTYGWAWAKLGQLYHERLERYEEAEKAYFKAAEKVPENPLYHEKYALLLIKLGKAAEALEPARKYFELPNDEIKSLEMSLELVSSLAAAGLGVETLDIIENSPSSSTLEPLIVGLKLYLGEEVTVATEILEIGKDVAKKIQAYKEEMIADHEGKQPKKHHE